MMLYDPGGGGIFVRDELRKIDQTIMNKSINCVPIVEYDDPTGMVGDAILVPFGRSTMQVQRYWGKMASPSVLVNLMHKAMQTAIDNKAVVLPGEWSKWKDYDIDTSDPDSMRGWLNTRSNSLGEMDKQRAELDLSVLQLSHIDVKRDAAGDPMVDQGGQFKFLSKAKKDSAYALIYGHTAVLILKHMISMGLMDEEGSGSDDIISGTLLNEDNHAAFQEHGYWE